LFLVLEYNFDGNKGLPAGSLSGGTPDGLTMKIVLLLSFSFIMPLKIQLLFLWCRLRQAQDEPPGSAVCQITHASASYSPQPTCFDSADYRVKLPVPERPSPFPKNATSSKVHLAVMPFAGYDSALMILMAVLIAARQSTHCWYLPSPSSNQHDGGLI
jgi:hypothetical protein